VEDELHKQHGLVASAEFELNWNIGCMNIATFKGSIQACDPPSNPSSHNQGWCLLSNTINNIKPQTITGMFMLFGL